MNFPILWKSRKRCWIRLPSGRIFLIWAFPLILSEGCAEIYNEKCLANCKAGIYHLNITHKPLIEEIGKLQREGYLVCATGLSDNTVEMHEVKTQDKMAFILGNEGSGVRKEVMEASDLVMKIDMRNIDSLNVGMAASIIMYQFRRKL